MTAGTEAYEMFVDGVWGPAASGETFDAVSPATGETIGSVPQGDRSDAERAIAAANRAFEGWSRLTAFDLENGAQAWTTPISAPSGRGVTVANRLYVPLAAGEVWSIDLKTGAVGNKWSLPDHVPSIGNLAMYRGMLLSVDAYGLTAFEQRDAVQSEIAARKQTNPRDPWALIREA